MQINIMGDRVLLTVVDEPVALASGIVLPGSANKTNNKAKVLAVGKGTKLANGTIIPLEVAVDDIVIFDPTDAEEVTVEGTKCLIVREKEIFLVLE